MRTAHSHLSKGCCALLGEIKLFPFRAEIFAAAGAPTPLKDGDLLKVGTDTTMLVKVRSRKPKPSL